MRVKISMDRNGNKIVTIPGNDAGRGFSIQTNGRLPSLHQLGKGWHELTKEQSIILDGDVSTFGTQHQMNIIDAAAPWLRENL